MIEASGLRKSYQSKHRRKTTTVEAVRGVDFSVQRGEIFGFLGPNGAGKTTTLRMLTTLIRPDGGDASIAGIDLRRAPAQVRLHIGFVAQQSGTYDESNARRDLVHQARMYGASKSEAKDRAEAAIGAFQLESFADRAIGTYSGGQRRRLDVALGVIHSPDVVFLDEPTAGLDPPSRARMWQEVRRLRDQGMTIFLTTHYLDEAEEMADRIGVINRGEITLVEDKAALMQKLGRKQLKLQLTRKLDAIPPALAKDGLTLSADGGELIYTYDTQGDRTGITGLLESLARAGISFKDLNTTQSSLEDIFVDLVK
jgi:ABC-2 type transport system ATP-binding protein